MIAVNCVLFLFVALSSLVVCQIQYVPANILIPTLNGSLIIPSNYTNNKSYNLTNSNNNSYNRPPYHYGNNSYNRVNYSKPYNGSEDGHLILGSINIYDRLLFNQVYYKPGRWYSTREKIIEYPKDLPAGYSRHETISAIKILNQFYDGNTARAEILSGGIGRQYVKIRLQSKWGKGFRYLVTIYGR